MDLWIDSLFGVRLFIWLFVLIAIICVILAFAFWKKDKIQEIYYKIKYPEKVIKIIIHYKGTFLYKLFWRLIPDKPDFSIDGKRYLYDSKDIIRDNDFYAYTEDSQLIVRVEGKKYILDDRYKILPHKKDNYPELHYFDNIPFAINYKDYEGNKLQVSAKDYNELADNDLWEKLLTMREQKGMMLFLMILGVGNILISLFILAKIMGWLK